MIRTYHNNQGDFKADLDCICPGHMLRVHWFKPWGGDEDDHEASVSFWGPIGRSKRSLYARLKLAWRLVMRDEEPSDVLIKVGDLIELADNLHHETERRLDASE